MKIARLAKHRMNAVDRGDPGRPRHDKRSSSMTHAACWMTYGKGLSRMTPAQPRRVPSDYKQWDPAVFALGRVGATFGPMLHPLEHITSRRPRIPEQLRAGTIKRRDARMRAPAP